jgi:hypothetical protein
MAGPVARLWCLRAAARRAAALAAAVLAIVSPADAQTWREYRYAGFAVQFPVEPKIEAGTFATDEGTTVNVRIYSARQEGALYKVTVADLSELNAEKSQEVSDSMIGQLAAGREVAVDVPHRVNRILGRQLSIVSDDGRRSAVALFFRARRLYLVEGTTLPTNGDSMSPDGMRFQQSLRFIIPSARGDFLCELRRAPRNLVDEAR